MIIPNKLATRPQIKTVLDILLLFVGVVGGGLLTLISLWLWFDYRADPSRSLLAIFSAGFVGLMPDFLQSYLANEARVMGLPLTGHSSAFWYIARSGGIVAYLLLWLSTVWGLTLSTKITDGLVPAPLAYGLHEFLSLGTVLFAVLHILPLLGDSYINFNIFHLAIPFTAPYEPFWTGLGTVAFYLIAALTGSFYIRKQLGQKIWRVLHYLTFVGYVLALFHGLLAGTDSALPVIRLLYLVSGVSVLFLVYYRLFTLKEKTKKPVRP
jgi:DMSO/TMAO reductase YedYZ heme-binding membrane subunit